jgi:hypothetical protein
LNDNDAKSETEKSPCTTLVRSMEYQEKQRERNKEKNMVPSLMIKKAMNKKLFCPLLSFELLITSGIMSGETQKSFLIKNEFFSFKRLVNIVELSYTVM